MLSLSQAAHFSFVGSGDASSLLQSFSGLCRAALHFHGPLVSRVAIKTTPQATEQGMNMMIISDITGFLVPKAYLLCFPNCSQIILIEPAQEFSWCNPFWCVNWCCSFKNPKAQLGDDKKANCNSQNQNKYEVVVK